MCIVEAPWSLDGGRRRAWALSHVPFALCACQIQTHKYKDKGKYLITKQNIPIYVNTNKTQCQLCKRLAGPIIPLSWSGKEVHIYGCDHWGTASNHFPVYSVY